MKSYLWVDIISYSLILPAIIGAVRFKRVLKSYRPFIFWMWVALCTEVIDDVAIALKRSDAVTNNIYTLVEYCFIIVLFMRLDESNNKKRYYILLGIGIITWIVDNIFLHSITDTSSYFRIIYGLIVVFLSVGKLNEVLFNEVRQSLKNGTLVICIAFIIFYTYQSVFEIFGVINLHFSEAFFVRLYYILIYVNLFTNLLYALAMLWLPTKRQFTLPY